MGLRADRVTLAYDARVVARDSTSRSPTGRFTVIVGPNACGKSTLLRALARMLKPRAGAVLLDGERDPLRCRPSEVARRLGLLPQSPIAPDGITVADLVARGRYRTRSCCASGRATTSARSPRRCDATGTADLAERPVDELSGGQRQRVWMAMALAQETPILLLDEPTTFLDIAHQIEVLDLCAELHERRPHDRRGAARPQPGLPLRDASDRDARRRRRRPGRHPREIVDAELVEHVFGVPLPVVIADPETGTPLVVPAAPGR